MLREVPQLLAYSHGVRQGHNTNVLISMLTVGICLAVVTKQPRRHRKAYL